MKPILSKLLIWCLTAALLAALAGTAMASAKFTPYGYIKLDASYDQAMTNDGDFVYYVLNKAENDDEFNMTAKQTRLGLKIEDNSSERVRVLGKVELDFYGGGAENKPNPMLRHAFMELQYPGFSILAGQTSDLFAPLNPNTLNYIVMWRCGNTGYRRPQIRLTKEAAIGEGGRLTISASLNRTIGQDQNGEDTGLPTEMGRMAISGKLFGERFATFGVSGLWGGEESDAFHKDFQTHAVAVDAAVPLGEKGLLQGEYYLGQNMASYMGGIGQGIDEIHQEELKSSGGWGHLALSLNENAWINVGAGLDDPEVKFGDTSNRLDKNVAVFINIIWQLHPAVSVGAEYLGMETTYIDEEKYQDNRGQISFQYSF